ncbi:VanZ family protein [Chitinasiproducens palmae]|uniref:VanZ like family protein n=1 Tax=Chitinasiproducens palmae TaxID=1770053 RepID=A0A1H2PPW3_9BURK|nr:VanZ family protein [Chitinasiproducens palmae]SDV48360.1 VanZ like family protein [Chitinasiproducens palmae]
MRLRSALPDWQRRASPLARQALAVYAALVLYGSLYPFRGWRSVGFGPFDYLAAPLPHYWTTFDVVINVLGYMPLGALLVWSFYPRLRNVRAVLLAALAGGALSFCIEAVQTYLPTRVASNLDLASNALGALLGGAVGVPLCGPLLDRGYLRRLRFHWFERHTSSALTLLGLWPIAQTFPQPFLFGTGDWPRALWRSADAAITDRVLGLSPWLAEAPARLAGLLDSPTWEAVIAASNVLAFGLFASLTLRPGAPRLRLIYGLLLLTLVVKAALDDVHSLGGALDWLTPGARLGLLAAVLLLPLALRLPFGGRAMLAFVLLLVAVVLVNVLPLNPYFDVILAGWRAGQYRHLNFLAQCLARVWPFCALAWLLVSAEQGWLARRARRRAGTYS